MILTQVGSRLTCSARGVLAGDVVGGGCGTHDLAQADLGDLHLLRRCQGDLLVRRVDIPVSVQHFVLDANVFGNERTANLTLVRVVDFIVDQEFVLGSPT